jgi:hypothetical protein
VKSLRDDPKAVGDSSRGIAAFRARFTRSGAVGLAVLALGLAAALLMVLAEVSNLVVVDVSGVGCEDTITDPATAEDCEITGGDQHSFALVAVAILTVVMAMGAGLGGSRPAGIALVVAGLLVLGIALIGDLPDTSSTGQVGPLFENAEAGPGSGFWFELVAGALAAAAGALRIWRPVSRAT